MSSSSDPDERSDESLPEPLRSKGALHDPFEWYERMRSDSPVRYDPQRDVYDVFTHEHVKRSLQDDDRFVRKELSGSHMSPDDPFSYLDNAMIWSDGPAHKQGKGQLFEYFRPSMLEGFRGSIEEISESQLRTALEGGPEFDFISDFAVPVPLRVIMDVVGVPQGDHAEMLEWLETFRSVMNSEYSAKESTDGDRMGDAVEYFRGVIAERKQTPRDDLISRLAAETELTDAEIGANCFDFILAGQGTMSEFLSNAIFLFAEHGLLGDIEVSDLPVVLEEVLRYRTPLQSRARVTAEPVSLGGTAIPEGETVILWLGSANRDPARYERPEVFAPERDPDHLAFGSGSHTCIGAPLARLQAPIVLETFLDRFDRIEIADGGIEPKPKASKLGFERLELSTTPTREDRP